MMNQPHYTFDEDIKHKDLSVNLEYNTTVVKSA